MVFGPSAQGKTQANDILEYAMSINDQVTKRPFDTINTSARSCKNFIREVLLTAEWYSVYDSLQILIETTPTPTLIKSINLVLQEEGAGFVWRHDNFIPLISKSESEAIEEALSKSNPVRRHLEEAISILSNKNATDFRNSVKESISAIEAACISITGNTKATLSDALKSLDLHPALKGSYIKLYGYTSDGDGIRHALTDDHAPVSRNMARYMLISCSAFINFLFASTI